MASKTSPFTFCGIKYSNYTHPEIYLQPALSSRAELAILPPLPLQPYLPAIVWADLAPFTIPTTLSASVSVRLVGVAVGVLSMNAPRRNRTGSTCSLDEEVLGELISDQPLGSRALFHSTIPRPTSHS